MSAGGKDAASRPLGPDGKPIPGPAEVRQIQAARKMAQQQAQVDEVIGIMHKNVENVLERDRKLGDLEERADALQDGCAQFEKQAAAMKNKFWMENLKAIIAGSVVGLIVLGLLYWKFFMDDQPQGGYPPQGEKSLVYKSIGSSYTCLQSSSFIALILQVIILLLKELLLRMLELVEKLLLLMMVEQVRYMINFVHKNILIFLST